MHLDWIILKKKIMLRLQSNAITSTLWILTVQHHCNKADLIINEWFKIVYLIYFLLIIKTLSGLENKFQLTWSKFDWHQKKKKLINTYPSNHYHRTSLSNNGNRNEWSPIWSVIIQVINKIGRPCSGSSICLITSMIRDQTGQHKVFLPMIN